MRIYPVNSPDAPATSVARPLPASFVASQTLDIHGLNLVRTRSRLNVLNPVWVRNGGNGRRSSEEKKDLELEHRDEDLAF